MKVKLLFLTSLVVLGTVFSLSVFASGTQESGSSTAMAKPITVAIFTSPEEQNLAITKEVFTKATGIDVQIDEIARNAFQSKFTTVLMSGSDAWDVLYLQGAFFQAMATAKTLLPIDGVISQDTISQLIPIAYKKAIFDGKLYGLVVGYHTNYYYHRTDLIANAGLSPATNWKEYLNIAQKLTGTGANGQPQYGAVFRGGGENNSVHYDFANYFLSFGAKWLDKDFKPVMNSPEGVAALQYFVDLKNKYNVVPPDVAAVAYNEKNQYFQSGKVAQMVQWSAAYSTLLSQKDSPDTYNKTGVILLPGRVQPDGSLHHGSLATNDMWVIPKNAKNKAGAEAFIKWMAEPAGAIEWAKNGGDPTNLKAYSDPATIKLRPDFQVAAKAIVYADTFPALPQGPELLNIWTDKIVRAVAGQLTAKQAMDQCADEWTAVLKKAGYYN